MLILVITADSEAKAMPTTIIWWIGRFSGGISKITAEFKISYILKKQ